MNKLKFSPQFYRHLRVTLFLLLLTFIFAYASFVYLNYFEREHGRPTNLADIIIIWSLPSIFAATTIAPSVITYRIACGIKLGLIRFFPLTILVLGVPIQLALSRFLANS